MRQTLHPRWMHVRREDQELGDVIANLWQKVVRRLARARERRRMVNATRQPSALAERLGPARAILFVCTGNIIRSVFAAELLRSRSGRTDVQIRSAGLNATDGPAHPMAVHCARRFGVDLGSHRTHRL